MAYFMARILNLACVFELKNDILYCMQMKVIRRLQKLFSTNESTFFTGMSTIFVRAWSRMTEYNVGYLSTLDPLHVTKPNGDVRVSGNAKRKKSPETSYSSF
jgi:hypothetical protein